MDERLRRLERQAATGEYDARQQWKHALLKAGYPDPDLEELTVPQTEAEEAQDHYDDLWWHEKGPKHFSWSSGCWCCFDVSKWAAKLMQDHHTWGHRGWNNRNSKRKTLRTHRDGSSKNHRRFQKRQETDDLAPHERRRKKRYGGREHRYGRDWVQNQRTGRYRVVYKFSYPNLDE